MTDRELIELAAKAAGYKIMHWNSHEGAYWIDQSDNWWNPLRNDGDALRLAVKLEISVSQWHSSVTAGAMLPVRATTERVTIASERPGATRRAITMAAAEIAKERLK